MHNRSRGFTLIELLVVIAIIAILSAVIIAGLNMARNKGNDAGVKANLKTFVTQSQFYLDTTTTGTYASAAISSAGPSQAACATASTVFLDPKEVQALSAADKATGGSGNATPTNVKCSINGTATAWTVWAPLSTSSTVGWCIDNTGISKPDTAPVAYSCP